MRNKIVRCVFNADLRCSHAGLEALGMSLKLDLAALQPGEVVCFVNSRKTQIKLFGAFFAIVHFKNRSGERIDLRTLQLIPKFFNGSKFEYDAALREILVQGGIPEKRKSP